MKIFVVGLSEFVDAVGNYQIVGAPWDGMVGYLVPWLEVVAGVALLLGICFRGAALLLIGLLLFFNTALAIAWSSGLEINCGCFGPSNEPTHYPIKILSNFGLVLAAIISTFAKNPLNTVSKTPDQPCPSTN